MVKRIIIKGDFELSGDIPGLHLLSQRFKFAEIEIVNPPLIRLSQFEGSIKNDAPQPLSEPKRKCIYCENELREEDKRDCCLYCFESWLASLDKKTQTIYEYYDCGNPKCTDHYSPQDNSELPKTLEPEGVFQNKNEDNDRLSDKTLKGCGKKEFSRVEYDQWDECGQRNEYGDLFICEECVKKDRDLKDLKNEKEYPALNEYLVGQNTPSSQKKSESELYRKPTVNTVDLTIEPGEYKTYFEAVRHRKRNELTVFDRKKDVFKNNKIGKNNPREDWNEEIIKGENGLPDIRTASFGNLDNLDKDILSEPTLDDEIKEEIDKDYDD